MPGLRFDKITKSFDGKTVLQDVSFEVLPGKISALLGPSGCGKSTLLSLAAGLETPDSGAVYWDGQDLTHTPPHQRGFGLMFQEYALFPHLNVAGNVAFGLRQAGLAKAAVTARVAEVLDLVGLGGFERRDVLSLSGGEQQRVALARSLAPEPCFLMLDEPLGALDYSLRERLILELGGILRSLNQTALYVTHDQGEAFSLADEVVLLNHGRVEQQGPPLEIYRRPASPFVASFLGLNNLLTAWLEDGTARCALGELPVAAPRPPGRTPPGRVTILLRPEYFRPIALDSPNPGPDTLLVRGEVRQRLLRSGSWRVILNSAGMDLAFDLPFDTHLPTPGEPLALSAPTALAVQVLGKA